MQKEGDSQTDRLLVYGSVANKYNYDVLSSLRASAKGPYVKMLEVQG
jgi:hypothetical protein